MTEDKDLQNINFADRNAVEKFLETNKFRPCANLECSRVALQNVVLYMPMCREGRFHRLGVAEFFDMPLPSRPLSPVTYMNIGSWAPLVSCPQRCKGYRNRTLAKIKTGLVGMARWMFGKNNLGEARSFHEERWWKRPLGMIAIGILVTVIGGLILWRIKTHYEKPTPQTREPESQSAQTEVRPQENTRPESTHQHGGTKKKVKIEQHGAGSGAVGGSVNTAPCGITQVGGNNNQATTNCGPKPLKMSEKQGREVAKLLSRFKGDVVEIDVDRATPETDQVANALASSLILAGIGGTRVNAIFHGGCLFYPGVSFMAGVNRQVLVKTIWDALVEEGVVDKADSIPSCSRNAEPNELHIYIRPNS